MTEELLKPDFYPTGRGTYKVSEVEEYIARVNDYCTMLSKRIESAEKDKRDLMDRIGSLSAKIEEYKQDEDNIKITLLKAQRMAASTISESKAEREEILEKAKEEAKALTEELRRKYEEELNEEIRKADEYLKNAEKEYKTKTQDAEKQAAELVQEAERKAKYIVSEARIRAAASIEKANAAILKVKEHSTQIASKAYAEASSLKELIEKYKVEMGQVLKVQGEQFDTLTVPEIEKPEVLPENFTIIDSQIDENVPDSFVSTKKETEITQDKSQEPEKKEPEPENKPEPEKKPEPAFASRAIFDTKPVVFGTTRPVHEAAEEEKESNSKNVSFSDIASFVDSMSDSGGLGDGYEELDEDPYESIFSSLNSSMKKASENSQYYYGKRPSFSELSSDSSSHKDRTRIFDSVKSDESDRRRRPYDEDYDDEVDGDYDDYDEYDDDDDIDVYSNDDRAQEKEKGFFSKRKKKK